MPRLSDTQLIILSAACSRPDRMVLPLPKSLKGGAATKVITSLIGKGLIAEVDANVVRGDPIWRDTGDGHGVTLIATEAADTAIDGGNVSAAPQPATALPQRPAKGKAAKVAANKTQAKARKAPKAVSGPAKGKSRDGTKQSQLIDMLKRAKGASIAEIAEAFGWQHHTVRGALAGALKKKLGLTITSEKDDRRGRVYRITE